MNIHISLLLITICLYFGNANEISAKNEKAKNPENIEISTDITKNVEMLLFNVAPHVFLDKKTGKVTGAIYEFINDHIAPEMGVKFIWKEELSNVPRQLNILRTKAGYAAALLVYSPNRAAVLDFTKIPYFKSQSTLVVRQNNPLKTISKIEDILHMKIGYAKGTYITIFMKNERIKFDLISHPTWNEANMQKLLLDRVDAVYAPDKAGLLYVIQKFNASKEVKIIDLPEEPAPFHIVFSKGSEEMVEKYNQAFDKLDGQILYKRLLGKYLDISLL